MSSSGTNAPVSVHISYQCSIGPDSPIYDVAHTPAPKPMARKVTTRRAMDLLPPLPADDGKILREFNAGPTPAPSPMAPHFPRAFPFDASVNAPGESNRAPVARSLTAPVEGMDEIRRRWAADAAVEAVRRRKQVASTSSDSEEDDCSHRRSQSARVSICVEDLAEPLSNCLADVDPARMRRRRNLARKGGSAHGLGKRSFGLSPKVSPVPRARSLLSVPGKAQPDAAHCSTDNASPASGDEDDPYMNLAQAFGGGSRSDLGLGPKASPADVSSAAMGFSVCEDSGNGGESVEDTRGNFQTVAELPIPAWELPLPAPADDAEVPDWDSPVPAPEPYQERLGMLARTKTVDSGYGDDPDPSRPTTPLSPDAAAPSQSVQLSLRSKNAGKSMVRRLGSLMGELAGELQTVRKQQSDVEA